MQKSQSSRTMRSWKGNGWLDLTAWQQKPRAVQGVLLTIAMILLSAFLLVVGDNLAILQLGAKWSDMPTFEAHSFPAALQDLSVTLESQPTEKLPAKPVNNVLAAHSNHSHYNTPKVDGSAQQESMVKLSSRGNITENAIHRDEHIKLISAAESETSSNRLQEKAKQLDRSEQSSVEWIQFPSINNETDELMRLIKENGTTECQRVKTATGVVLGLPAADSEGLVRLETGVIHNFSIVSMGEDGKQRCAGGDYYETDLSGPRWKSRPTIIDRQDGTYAVQLQMDGRSAGPHVLKIILLYTNFNGLRYHPQHYLRDEVILDLQIEFVLPESDMTLRMHRDDHANGIAANSMAPLSLCTAEDFNRKYWSGRWTRGNHNESCEIDRRGRFPCLDTQLECEKPWCEGPVGSLESNGWVYSAHCRFKIFKEQEAWKCLDKKWLFFWGDSNHIDTIRNLLNFVLGYNHNITFLPRRMDETYVRSRNPKQSVRITSMFNGHANVTMNYQGLFSLHDPAFQEELKTFFVGKEAPDVMIMNSGLHDGVYWRSTEEFFHQGVEYAINFWQSVWQNLRAPRPDLIYRTTVATAAHARGMSFDPQKMEIFNHLFLDSWLKLNLPRFKVVDGFDYTFPWHYTTEHSDGVHYGRPPAKSKWAGGRIGHQYFVDVMLAHILLNSICNT